MIDLSIIREEYLEFFPEEYDQLTRFKKYLHSNDYNNACNRNNFSGHLTASGIILSSNKMDVFLVYHNTFKRFIQPGGHIEEIDQNPIEASRREIKEETSLTNLIYLPLSKNNLLPFDIGVHDIAETKKHPAHLHFDFRYLFISKETNYSLKKDEVAEGRWAPLDELHNLGGLKKIPSKVKLVLERNLS